MRTVTYIEMGYKELETIVAKAYGISGYRFAAVQECGNDSSHTFDVTEPQPLDEWSANALAEFVAKNGNRFCVNHIIMQDLVNREILQPGNYLIEVMW